MDDKNKLIIGAAVIGGLILMSKKPVVDQDQLDQTGISIVITDSRGNVVPHNSPFLLDEGQSYNAVVTAKNLSSKGGVFVAVDAVVKIAAIFDSPARGRVNLAPQSNQSKTFAAGEQKTFSYPFSTQDGDGGGSGGVYVEIANANNELIANSSEEIQVQKTSINYNFVISFGETTTF